MSAMVTPQSATSGISTKSDSRFDLMVDARLPTSIGTSAMPAPIGMTHATDGTVSGVSIWQHMLGAAGATAPDPAPDGAVVG